MISDRIFALIVTIGALAYVVFSFQIPSGFISGPVGPRGFPILVGLVGMICGLSIFFKPDPEPHWPKLTTLLSLGGAVLVLVMYALSLKPFGFLMPTAVAAAILSYQISPRIRPAVLAGLGLSIGLFVIFKYALGLGLTPFPRGLF